MELPDYARGEHFAPDAAICRAYKKALQAGQEFTLRDRQIAHDTYVQNYPNNSLNVVTCGICQEIIAEHMLLKKDPFLPSAEIKSLLYGFQVGKLSATRRSIVK